MLSSISSPTVANCIIENNVLQKSYVQTSTDIEIDVIQWIQTSKTDMFENTTINVQWKNKLVTLICIVHDVVSMLFLWSTS